MEKETEVDIIIVGGGIAGCIAAISLSATHSVAVIDKLVTPIERIGECLAPAARRILKQLNLLNGLENTFPQKEIQLKNIGTQSYWGSEVCHVVDHLRNPDGFGWHLDRQAFESYLRETTAKRGVDCFWGVSLHHCEYKSERWKITTQSLDQKTRNFSARFVIDASGRQSHFARKLGVERTHYDKLIAHWAVLTNTEENKMSSISSDPLGWWYTAPLPNNKRVMAFQTDSDLMTKTALKNADSFIELAKNNKEMARILIKNTAAIQYHGTVSANSTRLNQVSGLQWVALGDAVMSFDPLSSQGMFNAMASGVQLADLILETNLILQPNDLNSAHFHNAYAKQMNQIWQHYQKHKYIFYGEEKRWTEAAFWKRRHIV
jgi:flavin-dependent dehydrogenase